MIDITRTLSEATPVWPGDAPVRILRDDWPKNGPYVSSVHLTLHAGTHADAPLHYDAGASDIAGLGLTPFIGLCFVLELPEGHESIDAPLLERLPAHTRRVLFKTPASGFNGQAYIESGYGLTARAARRVAGAGFLLVGVDGPSVGAKGPEGDAVHRILLSSGVAVVEGLDLSRAREGEYMLFCPPLKIAGGEGAPLRAVLI